jgi:hypothetical protein
MLTGRVGDTDHNTSTRVSGPETSRARDNAGTLRRQLRVGDLRGHRPQPATRRRHPRRNPPPQRPRRHPAPSPGQHPRPPGPTSTPPDPAPTHPLALGTRMDHPVAQHHRPTIQRLTTAAQPDDQDRQEKLGRPAAKPRRPANTIKIKHSTHHHGVDRWNQAKHFASSAVTFISIPTQFNVVEPITIIVGAAAAFAWAYSIPRAQ